MLLVSVDHPQLDRATRTEIVFDESKVLGNSKNTLYLNEYLEEESRRNFEPEKPANVFLKHELTKLYERWLNETGDLSSVDEILQSKYYKQIVARGQSMIPAIMNLLEQGPTTLVWALNDITQSRVSEKPISLTEATQKWLQWGRANRFI